MKRILNPSRSLICSLAVAAAMAAMPGSAQATPITTGCGITLGCGVTLINNAESAVGGVGGSYFSSVGLSGVVSSGIATFTPGALDPALTAATITATTDVATAVAAANLADGTLHAKANSAPVFGSTAIAESNDTLHWVVSGGGQATITLNAHVDGTITPGPSNAFFQDVFALAMTSNVTGSDPSLQFTGNNLGFGPSNSGGGGTSGWQTMAFSNSSLTGFDFTGTFLVEDGEAQTFFDELSVDCRTGSLCDFSNTGAVSFVLPTGVSYTSDSGVFLTQTPPIDGGPSAVPEPGTIALVGTGVAAAAARLRRRRR